MAAGRPEPFLSPLDLVDALAADAVPDGELAEARAISVESMELSVPCIEARGISAALVPVLLQVRPPCLLRGRALGSVSQSAPFRALPWPRSMLLVRLNSRSRHAPRGHRRAPPPARKRPLR